MFSHFLSTAGRSLTFGVIFRQCSILFEFACKERNISGCALLAVHLCHNWCSIYHQGRVYLGLLVKVPVSAAIYILCEGLRTTLTKGEDMKCRWRYRPRLRWSAQRSESGPEQTQRNCGVLEAELGCVMNGICDIDHEPRPALLNMSNSAHSRIISCSVWWILHYRNRRANLVS